RARPRARGERGDAPANRPLGFTARHDPAHRAKPPSRARRSPEPRARQLHGPEALPALAGRAEGGAAAPEGDLAEGGGAAGAGAAGLAVGDQEVGVAAALAVDHAVVAEGGALAVDG